MLKEIQELETSDNRYPVVLHGFITSVRQDRQRNDYLQFVDPNLRSTVQVVFANPKSEGKSSLEERANVKSAPIKNISSVDEFQAYSGVQQAHDTDRQPQKTSDVCTIKATAAEGSENNHASVDLEGPDLSNITDGARSSQADNDGKDDDLDTSTPISKITGTSPSSDARSRLRSNLRPHTPVVVCGFATKKDSGEKGHISSTGKRATTPYLDAYVGQVDNLGWMNITATNIKILNNFPKNIIAKHETNFGPDQRHLELRTKHNLRQSIRLRSMAMAQTRKYMFMKGFDEIDTPLLFRSTPEGAREFMVPTRRKGMAYALPQSPQQYKQILMASGFSRYFQFAKCFRDEDGRADRQPEFTQVSQTHAACVSLPDIETSWTLKCHSLLARMLWSPSSDSSRKRYGQDSSTTFRTRKLIEGNSRIKGLILVPMRRLTSRS